MNELRNIECLSDIRAIQVSSHPVFELLRCLKFGHLEVLLMKRHLSESRERAAHARVLSPIKIVDVEVLDVGQRLVVQVVADWRVVVLQVDCVPVEDAVVRIYLIHQLLWDHAPGGDRFDQLVICVNVVIGDTVADDETLQVDSVIILLIHLLLEVPLVDLPCQVGNVYSSI